MTAWDQFKQGWREASWGGMMVVVALIPASLAISFLLVAPHPLRVRVAVTLFGVALTALLLRRVRWPGRR